MNNFGTCEVSKSGLVDAVEGGCSDSLSMLRSRLDLAGFLLRPLLASQVHIGR